jgi:hypothetical protein
VVLIVEDAHHVKISFGNSAVTHTRKNLIWNSGGNVHHVKISNEKVDTAYYTLPVLPNPPRFGFFRSSTVTNSISGWIFWILN